MGQCILINLISVIKIPTTV